MSDTRDVYLVQNAILGKLFTNERFREVAHTLDEVSATVAKGGAMYYGFPDFKTIAGWTDIDLSKVKAIVVSEEEFKSASKEELDILRKLAPKTEIILTTDKTKLSKITQHPALVELAKAANFSGIDHNGNAHSIST